MTTWWITARAEEKNRPIPIEVMAEECVDISEYNEEEYSHVMQQRRISIAEIEIASKRASITSTRSGSRKKRCTVEIGSEDSSANGCDVLHTSDTLQGSRRSQTPRKNSI